MINFLSAVGFFTAASAFITYFFYFVYGAAVGLQGALHSYVVVNTFVAVLGIFLLKFIPSDKVFGLSVFSLGIFGTHIYWGWAIWQAVLFYCLGIMLGVVIILTFGSISFLEIFAIPLRHLYVRTRMFFTRR